MFGTPGQAPTGESADSISGGGFSDYWPMPKWQEPAVKQYLAVATNLPDQKVRAPENDARSRCLPVSERCASVCLCVWLFLCVGVQM